MLEIKQVRTEADYDAALARISELLGSEPYNPEDEELDRISVLVERYETENYPMEEPEPASIVEFLLDQQIVIREQLIPLAGGSADLDAILAGHKEITPEMAQLLCERSGIPVEALLRTSGVSGVRCRIRLKPPDNYWTAATLFSRVAAVSIFVGA